MIYALGIQIAIFIALSFANASMIFGGDGNESGRFLVLFLKLVGTGLSVAFVVYGLVWGFIKENILIIIPIRGTPADTVDGIQAWIVGAVWIFFGLYGIQRADLYPPVTEAIRFLFARMGDRIFFRSSTPSESSV